VGSSSTRASHPDGYANGRATRSSIVQAAGTHFAIKGFNAATVRDIAAAVGISRAGLLRHFPSKENLLQAVLEDRDVRDREHFRPYARIRGGVGILQGMIDLAKRNEQTPGMVDLFIRLSTEAGDPSHPAHAYFRERYAGIRAGTTQTLRSAAAASYLRGDVAPGDAAARLTALMDGLQVQWVLDPRQLMHPHVHQAVAELLNDAGREALLQAAASAATWAPDQASSVTSRGPQHSDIVHGLVVAG